MVELCNLLFSLGNNNVEVHNFEWFRFNCQFQNLNLTCLCILSFCLSWQELMHHIGLYIAKGRGANVVSEVSFGAWESHDVDMKLYGSKGLILVMLFIFFFWNTCRWKYVKIREILFKNWKMLLKMSYQTVLKFFIWNDFQQYFLNN